MSEVSLSGWMKALIAYVRSGEPDLTNRQMALLMLVYLSPGPHTVRGLARVLGVSKPVVTRALNTLGALGYLRRERDQDDRRNVFVVRTSNGADFLEGFKRNLRESDGSPNGPSADHRPSPGLRAPPLNNSSCRARPTFPTPRPAPIATILPTSRSPAGSSPRIMPSPSAAPSAPRLPPESTLTRRRVAWRVGGRRTVRPARRQFGLGLGLWRNSATRRLYPEHRANRSIGKRTQPPQLIEAGRNHDAEDQDDGPITPGCLRPPQWERSHPDSALSTSVPIALLRTKVTTVLRIGAVSDSAAAPCGLIVKATAQAMTAANSRT